MILPSLPSTFTLVVPLGNSLFSTVDSVYLIGVSLTKVFAPILITSSIGLVITGLPTVSETLPLVGFTV